MPSATYFLSPATKSKQKMPLSNAEGLAQRKSFLWSYTMLWPAQLQWHKDSAARRTHTLCVMVLAYHFFHSVWLRLFIFFTLPISHLLLHTSYFTPPTSHLLLHTSYFTPPTSHLLLHTSYFTPPTSKVFIFGHYCIKIGHLFVRQFQAIFITRCYLNTCIFGTIIAYKIGTKNSQQ